MSSLTLLTRGDVVRNLLTAVSIFPSNVTASPASRSCEHPGPMSALTPLGFFPAPADGDHSTPPAPPPPPRSPRPRATADRFLAPRPRFCCLLPRILALRFARPAPDPRFLSLSMYLALLLFFLISNLRSCFLFYRFTSAPIIIIDICIVRARQVRLVWGGARACICM